MAQDLDNKWRTRKGNGALPNVAMKDEHRHCIEKLNERIEGYMQNQLAEFKLGRIALHLVCFYRDKNFAWHWRGIVRELSQGAVLVSPASKCDATERWFDNSSLGESLRNATTVRRHRSAGNDAMGALRPFTD